MEITGNVFLKTMLTCDYVVSIRKKLEWISETVLFRVKGLILLHKDFVTRFYRTILLFFST